MEYAIFISYRRQGGAHFARILKAELEKRGYRDRIFLDYDELKDGCFDSRIMQAIDSAPIFIFILSPGSLDRCVNENDWVRQEILYAIKHERHIIPVNFDGLFQEFPVQVPLEIKKGLGQHQFTKIDSEALLNASVEKLIADRLAPIVPPAASNSNPTGRAEIVIIPDADCQVLRFHKLLARAKANTETFIHLCKGNHRLDFVSIENPDIKETLKYTVPDNDYSDFIEIKLKENIDKVEQIRLEKEHREYLESLQLFAVKNINNKWGFIDKTGKEIIPCIYKCVYSFNEGLAAVKNEDGKYGFIDKTGKMVISCIHNSRAYPFSEGLAPFEKVIRPCTGNPKILFDISNNYWGVIDKTGKEVIPCIYDWADFFNEGLAAVRKGLRWGFIDKTGKEIIPCIYKCVYSFNEGLAAVTNEDGKGGFIDKTGKEIIPCIYEYVASFNEGLAAVRKGPKWGFIDKTGKEIIPCIYGWTNFFNEGLAAVRKGPKWGFIDKAGKEIIPCIYGCADFFNEGLAAVRKGPKWGFIDKTGKEIIPCIYKYVASFNEGLAAVTNEDGKWGFIDKTGKEIIPCIYLGVYYNKFIYPETTTHNRWTNYIMHDPYIQ